MKAALAHIDALWGRWWFVPAIPVGYAIVMLAIGDLRGEHVGVALTCVVLAYSSERTKQFFVDAVPYVMVAMGYDIVRYAREAVLTPDRVIGCGLRNLELSLFSVAPGVTIQQWLQAHSVVALDLLFAVPYTIFAYFALLYAGYLFFVDRPRMRHYLWAFAIANFISFSMWLLVPAAPPWYIQQHGCVIDLSTAPNPAALTRVDALLGISYFDTFYSRASSVFGALPSMHCAYPMLGLLTAWRHITWRTKWLHLAYVVVMFGASVYLNHHWIVDGVAGWIVAGVAVWGSGRLLRRFGGRLPGPGKQVSHHVEPVAG